MKQIGKQLTAFQIISFGLSDGSVAGDWRLPNINELQSLIDYGSIKPALPSGHPFEDVNLDEDKYWSGTSYTTFNKGLYINISTGMMVSNKKTTANSVWLVRDGK